MGNTGSLSEDSSTEDDLSGAEAGVERSRKTCSCSCWSMWVAMCQRTGPPKVLGSDPFRAVRVHPLAKPDCLSGWYKHSSVVGVMFTEIGLEDRALRVGDHDYPGSKPSRHGSLTFERSSTR